MIVHPQDSMNPILLALLSSIPRLLHHDPSPTLVKPKDWKTYFKQDTKTP
jgi:hypothetical protein